MKTRYLTATGVGIVALVAAATSDSSAFASDMSVEKTDHSGCYIGLTGGYGWGQGDVSAEIEMYSEDGKSDLGGGMIGGLAGCNFSVGNGLVLGVAGDMSWAHIDGNADLSNADGDSGYGVDVGVDWLGTARAVIGYEFGNAMIYGTGGLAVAGVGVDLHLDGTGHIESDNSTQYGWTIGAGLNYMITDNVMIGAEYLYADFGEHGYDFGAAGEADVDVNMHIVRGTIGYRF
jgi:outer membrane immunogenic protein